MDDLNTIRLTPHAQKRIRERHISLESIVQTVSTGQMMVQGGLYKGCLLFKSNNYIVIMRSRTSNDVLTAWPTTLTKMEDCHRKTWQRRMSVVMQQLNPKPPNRQDKRYKTKLCLHFKRGDCVYGENCNFAHGEEELRNQK